MPLEFWDRKHVLTQIFYVGSRNQSRAHAYREAISPTEPLEQDLPETSLKFKLTPRHISEAIHRPINMELSVVPFKLHLFVHMCMCVFVCVWGGGAPMP